MDAGHLGQEDQLVGLELYGHAGRDFFHVQVEGLARGREAEWRQQHHRVHVQRLANRVHIDLAHQA
ncbi:hypothetical protein D3C71_1900480 [compost metagenome]